MTYRGGVIGGNEGRVAGISEKELGIFGLTAVEAKIILCLLERGSLGVSKISRETDIPHTSVHSAIRRLQKQGLVRRLSKGYSSIWKVVGLEKIHPRVSKALKPFGSELSQEELEEYMGTIVPNETNFQTFRKIGPVLRAYQWFLLNHHGECVREIQGIGSFECEIQTLGKETMAQLSDFRVTNRIRTELIIVKSSLDTYPTYVATNKPWAVNVEKSNTSVYIVLDESLEQKTHTMITNNAAIIVNWKDVTLELVKTSDLLKLLNVLFENLKKNGEFFDYSAYIQHLIEERGKA